MTKSKCNHIPAIVHRSGGIPADILNTCGHCGSHIIPEFDPGDQMIIGWKAITDKEADEMRTHWKATKI